MNFKWIGSAFLCSVMAFACGGGGGGGGSGVDADVALLDVTAGEAGDVCDYIINLQEQPERTVDCGDGTTVTVGTTAAQAAEDIADCTTDLQAVAADCAATVGDLEACFEDLSSASDAELCSDAPLPAACAPVFPCLGG